MRPILPVELLGLLCNEEFSSFLFYSSFIVSKVHYDVGCSGWHVEAGGVDD